MIVFTRQATIKVHYPRSPTFLARNRLTRRALFPVQIFVCRSKTRREQGCSTGWPNSVAAGRRHYCVVFIF